MGSPAWIAVWFGVRRNLPSSPDLFANIVTRTHDHIQTARKAIEQRTSIDEGYTICHLSVRRNRDIDRVHDFPTESKRRELAIGFHLRKRMDIDSLCGILADISSSLPMVFAAELWQKMREADGLGKKRGASP